ncbi:DUF2938 domain-containing protein [Frateuria sp. MAH-13]|uniref:DUF2938 domain-containing protein n=1 Tax=Frateuria flava TaxID=2821489 RepID=A0ABS4DIA7_9GAMM|nr:DUF2938 domain-containing protein [Frateuria flava]MBP1472784.1 DUF2938 domain-containing protein [Frateuria flava]
MAELAHFLFHAAVVGMGATLVMDAWWLCQKHLFGVPVLDYAMVGRWLGHLVRGRLRHDAIKDAPRVAGERAIGWMAHYAIGVGIAAMLLAVAGVEWAHAPSPGPALAMGLVSVLAPFLVLQPALGAGIAASRTPRPGVARRRSLVTHLVFGLGLYLAGEGWMLLFRLAG